MSHSIFPYDTMYKSVGQYNKSPKIVEGDTVALHYLHLTHNFDIDIDYNQTPDKKCSCYTEMEVLT